jgi:opacity protein-like surface antigen
MKRFIVFVVLFVAIGFTEVAQAQLVKDSWAVGFGFNYPRFMSINITPLNSNYGGYVSLQRNFSEHVGLRLKAGYNHLESEFTNSNSALITTSTNSIVGDLDLVYYLVPCEPVSPYVFAGLGGNYRMLTNPFGASKTTAAIDDNAFAMQYGLGVGLEWALDETWKLSTEFGYHTANNSELDGTVIIGEVSSKDTYMNISVGLQYFFDKGEPSKYCQLYSGIVPDQKDLTNYSKIEDMIVKHIPKEVTKEVVVEKMVKPTVSGKWILVGNNFEFNKSTLTAESYPMLYDAAKTLLLNPDAKIEIHGYTDNIGSESYNKKLSERRAETVKDYLVSKGVAAGRITVFAEGESNPVSDNNTAEGRAMNRRIEFKVQ